MADRFERVVAGQEYAGPNADLHNAIVEVLKRDYGRKRVLSEPAADPGTPLPFELLPIAIKNVSGAPLDQFSIVGLGDPIVTPAQNLDEFRVRLGFLSAAVVPDKPFAILQRSIPNDSEIGTAYLAGVSRCQINVMSLDHKFATSIAGDYTKLISQAAGPARILWTEPAASTTLVGAISSGGTTITVASSDGFPALPFDVTIEAEQLTVTAISGVTWTVTRGANGSTAASHADAKAINFTGLGVCWGVILWPVADSDSVITLTDGILAGGTYDATLAPSEAVGAWDVGTTVWSIDLSGSTAQPAGARFITNIVRDSNGNPLVAVGGPTYIAAADNTGDKPPSANWIVKNGNTGAYDSGGRYSLGMSVTSGGSTYLYINAAPSIGVAVTDTAHWLLLPSGFGTSAAWDSNSAYNVGDSTQLARLICSFNSAPPTNAGIVQINGDFGGTALPENGDYDCTQGNPTIPNPGLVWGVDLAGNAPLRVGQEYIVVEDEVTPRPGGSMYVANTTTTTQPPGDDWIKVTQPLAPAATYVCLTPNSASPPLAPTGDDNWLPLVGGTQAWERDKHYVAGNALTGTAYYMPAVTSGNLNQNPINNPDYWAIADASDPDLADYIRLAAPWSSGTDYTDDTTAVTMTVTLVLTASAGPSTYLPVLSGIVFASLNSTGDYSSGTAYNVGDTADFGPFNQLGNISEDGHSIYISDAPACNTDQTNPAIWLTPPNGINFAGVNGGWVAGTYIVGDQVQNIRPACSFRTSIEKVTAVTNTEPVTVNYGTQIVLDSPGESVIFTLGEDDSPANPGHIHLETADMLTIGVKGGSVVPISRLNSPSIQLSTHTFAASFPSLVDGIPVSGDNLPVFDGIVDLKFSLAGSVLGVEGDGSLTSGGGLVSDGPQTLFGEKTFRDTTTINGDQTPGIYSETMSLICNGNIRINGTGGAPQGEIDTEGGNFYALNGLFRNSMSISCPAASGGSTEGFYPSYATNVPFGPGGTYPYDGFSYTESLQQPEYPARSNFAVLGQGAWNVESPTLLQQADTYSWTITRGGSAGSPFLFEFVGAFSAGPTPSHPGAPPATSRPCFSVFANDITGISSVGGIGIWTQELTYPGNGMDLLGQTFCGGILTIPTGGIPTAALPANTVLTSGSGPLNNGNQLTNIAGRPISPKNYSGYGAPTVNDDSTKGYSAGSTWIG